MKKYVKADSAPYIKNIMLNVRMMAHELKEHRYYFEQNVAHRTGLLLKRIELLETCNATLCSKLASSQRELTTLQQHSAKNELFIINQYDTKEFRRQLAQ